MFTHLRCRLCILVVSDLELGRQIIHQPIRLDALNLLQFTIKLCVQRFGGKFKKCVCPERSASA